MAGVVFLRLVGGRGHSSTVWSGDEKRVVASQDGSDQNLLPSWNELAVGGWALVIK